MVTKVKPALFGLQNSNRDFSKKQAWGKNQFNTAFPVSLCCYFEHHNINAIYLKIAKGAFAHAEIEIAQLLGKSTQDTDTYFAFETPFLPYQKYIVGKLPRIDMVVQNLTDNSQSCGLEIKLTALPDNSTCGLTEEDYGCELVVRPDTIVYLACSLAHALQDTNFLCNLIDFGIKDWSQEAQVLPHISNMLAFLRDIYNAVEHTQTPFLLQPIWKTLARHAKLAQHCLDIFVWSNAGFLHFLTEIAGGENPLKINRQQRTIIWLYKMLYSLSMSQKFDPKSIIDRLSYNTKNDKAFASSGNVTNPYMRCQRLLRPTITKEAIKEIILGGGQNYLSPERRFDAVLFHSPELFS
ncbi:HindVP family restriction endonuclease [Helicobacter vulpis]|uniref:HindVP family restriction endonuclease n=1 Tax=Helicobacter vulpis TaxID=2316076 RepID=UPI000EB4B1D9|nr:HindVP family restriction endonuclease [Helicobacter vulpis]